MEPKLKDLELKDFMILQNRFCNSVIIAGRSFANLTVILTMANQYDFSVLYTENNFNSFNTHRYCCLKDAYEDFNNAYVIERNM